MVKKYDWPTIQEFYDAGNSWRSVQREYGVSFRALQKARDRGDLIITRGQREAAILSYEQGRVRTVHTEAFKAAVSERQSLHNSGGRCKWFEIEGQTVQGTWELNAARRLTELGVVWYKVGRQRSEVWRYDMDGKTRSYTPDFYLPKFDLFLEFKGYWWGRDKEKMAAVIAQHPDKNIRIIQKSEYEKLLTGLPDWLILS